jgi:hypothetical protein
MHPHYSPQSRTELGGLSQLTLFPEISQCLTVELVPENERVTPTVECWRLVLAPSGVRIAGQFFADEVDQIINFTKRWEWRLDTNGRLRNFAQLENLIDQIIQGGQH